MIASRATPARVITAIVTAFTVAAVGAALGAWAGWRGAPALPSDQAALSLIGPNTGLRVVERHDAAFAYEHPAGPLTWIIGDDDYNGGSVFMITTTATVEAITAGLAAQDWHKSDNPDYGGSALSRADLWVNVYPAHATARPSPPGGPAEAVAVELARSQPAPVWPFTAAGYALGLAAGALLGFAARRLSLFVLAAGLLLMLPGTVLTTGDLVAALTLPADVSPPALWGDYLFFGVRALTTVGLLLLAAAIPLSYRDVRRGRGA
ncbi:hypothetical protein [Dactylosporangium sp. NPDC051484]|uniref:hypothetical protein n=1 Tax=Dactylosporangium sp. NPDC051484 TaxID=3154942 RepID=UPI00344DFFFF